MKKKAKRGLGKASHQIEIVTTAIQTEDGMLEESTRQVQKVEDDHKNTEQTVGDLSASIKSFFLSSQFSDLVIKTTEQEFKVHKLIVCAQSEYFAQVYKGDWANITDNPFELHDDHPRAIEAMLHFMYGFEYDSSGNDVSRMSPMLFNVKVYQVADKYFVPQLKQRAKDKFEQIARTCWQMDDFPVAIAEAYRCTQKHDRGLRELLVQISQDHIGELVKSESFRSVLEEIAGFAADLALTLSWGESPKASCKYSCSQCSRTWSWYNPEGVFRYCPFCGRYM